MIGVAIDYLVMTNFFVDRKSFGRLLTHSPIPFAHNRYFSMMYIHKGSASAKENEREREAGTWTVAIEGEWQTNRLRQVHFANAASINLV